VNAEIRVTTARNRRDFFINRYLQGFGFDIRLIAQSVTTETTAFAAPNKDVSCDPCETISTQGKFEETRGREPRQIPDAVNELELFGRRNDTTIARASQIIVKQTY
jgi:hypothetical protein